MPPQESSHSNEELYKLTLENNKILRRLQRHQRISIFLTAMYWIVIIGTLAGAYYYVRPIVGVFTGNNQKVQDTFDQFDALRAQFPEAKMFDSFLNKLRGGTQTATTTEE